MNSFAVITFVACVAAANAGWLQGPSAHIIQGPSSKTTLIGPEGSIISAHAPGGQIVHEEHPGVIAHAAPVYGHISPVVSHSAPVVAHAAHAAPATVVAHSSAYGHEGVLIAGPSGQISTGYAAHAVPASVHAYGAVGYGHEGQYVSDHLESLYDDGSYKPHVYHH
ncbi:uncharacterized protein LOC125504842 isoform X2 [Dendroctonus ponderosae]|uniref:uncharacterized protein LOC125504842 isoform X2 n=1 Tax=Dendroctonus ponderosae TaxID=77166 RepID=UPI0020357D36|nr:uncharacterized protein LOC125504842 isoform X2 [Dendroctonus ponderosae]